MVFPAYLKEGSVVGIVATARKMTLEELREGISLFKNNGFKIRLGATIGRSFNQFSGTINERVKDLQAMLDDPDIDAIWCARGGYGTIHLIDELDFSKFLNNPKWLIGYSDITVLHSKLNKLQVASIHGPMPIDMASIPQALNTPKNEQQRLVDLLKGNKVSYRFKSEKENSLGTAKGELVGGNLSVLYSMCGSNTAIQTQGKILFIEDLDEYLYHIDRMFQNLKRNGVFKNLAGLIVGGMTKMHDNTIPFGLTIEEIVKQTLGDVSFPVCFNFPAGHMKNHQALIFGSTVALHVSEEIVTLEYNGHS